MCWSCGCGHLEDTHGDARSLVTADLQAAADQADISIAETVANIVVSLSHFDPSLAKSVETEGRILKSSDADRFLLMVAYSPNRMPLRGADGFVDVVSPEVLEKACWRFAENGYRLGVDHKPGGEDAGRVVENTIYRNPIPWVTKDAAGNKVAIREGDWLVGVILTPKAWEDYRNDRWGGISLQGRAKRRPADPATLARVGGSE